VLGIADFNALQSRAGDRPRGFRKCLFCLINSECGGEAPHKMPVFDFASLI
jgi:hypothetical protein